MSATNDLITELYHLLQNRNQVIHMGALADCDQHDETTIADLIRAAYAEQQPCKHMVTVDRKCVKCGEYIDDDIRPRGTIGGQS